MDKSIKCLLMDVDNVIISEVVEVDAQLGDPNCKMINPYLFRSIEDMIPWPKATNQRELMIRSTVFVGMFLTNHKRFKRTVLFS